MFCASYACVAAYVKTALVTCVSHPAVQQWGVQVRHMDALVDSVAVLLGFILMHWSFSVATGNYSWVDRFWSITPIVYVGVWTYHSFATYGALSFRVCVMFLLVLLWGARLSFNYGRKGGYQKGHEDYRWIAVRKGLLRDNTVLWHVFNLVFTAA
jgi:steroid 5-alpha reductase family enzyme